MRAFIILYSGFPSPPGPENLFLLMALGYCGDSVGFSGGTGRQEGLSGGGGAEAAKSAC